MAATIPDRSISPGSKRTVARSVARLTTASLTPSARRRKRSMRLTQLANVIPYTGTVSYASAGGAVDMVETWVEGIGPLEDTSGEYLCRGWARPLLAVPHTTQNRGGRWGSAGIDEGTRD